MRCIQLGIDKIITAFTHQYELLPKIILKSGITKEELEQYNQLHSKINNSLRELWSVTYEEEVKDHVKNGGISGSFCGSSKLKDIETAQKIIEHSYLKQ